MRTKPVIIIGAGGHGRVLMDILLDIGIQVIGFLDNDATLQGKDFCGVPILGRDEEIVHYQNDKLDLVNGIGSTGVASLRRNIYEKFKAHGFHFRQVIHPSAVISRCAVLDEGVQVMAGAVINIGSRIGENTIINTRASVDHDCRIGKHVHIAPGVTLSGGVMVEAETLVGTGSCVIQGIRIGEGSLVGAGSAVIHDVSNHAMMSGTPAMLIRTVK